MNQRISSYYRTLAWVALFIVIGSLYAYYFLIYVSEREDAVVARGFRILNNYRLNMEDKDKLNVKRVNTLGESFIKRDLFYYIADCDPGEDNKKDGNTSDDGIKMSKNGKCINKDSYRLNYIEYSDFLSDKIKFQIGDTLDVCPDDSHSACGKRNERSVMVNTPNAPPFIMYALFDISELSKIISNFDIKPLDTGSVGYIKTTLDDFLNGLKYDDLLENLVVLNKGKVIYNENPDEFVYSDQNLDSLTDKSAPSGSYKFVMVNSIRKMAISMPVTLFNQDLIIMGFIDGDLFSRLTRSINAHFLFVLASLILFLIIIFPFLKVYLISQNERLGSEDIYFSGFSVILGASLGILIIFGLYNHFILENNQLKEKLTSATRHMKSEISKDVSRAVRFKNAILDSLQQYGDYLTPDSVQLNYHSLVQDTSFDFNELLLLDANDGHFEYMLVLPGNRRPEEHLKDNQVSYRTYFQRARDNRLWHVNLDSMGSEYFFIESIYSIASQKGEAAISFPKTKLRTADGGFGLNVVPVVTSALPSLFKPILPKDMSFAIVDSECKTLFHENYRKNDKENFWVETGNNKHLNSSSAKYA